MSDRWEESIRDWYLRSHTANLEYLDLSSTNSVNTKQIAHNLSVIYDKTCLSSRVHLKNFKQLLEGTKLLEARITKLEEAVTSLTVLLLQTRPLKPTPSPCEITSTIKDLTNKIENIETTLLKIEQWTHI